MLLGVPFGLRGMAYIKMWLRWQAPNPDSMEIVGSSDT